MEALELASQVRASSPPPVRPNVEEDATIAPGMDDQILPEEYLAETLEQAGHDETSPLAGLVAERATPEA
jgi:hypothetical protein